MFVVSIIILARAVKKLAVEAVLLRVCMVGCVKPNDNINQRRQQITPLYFGGVLEYRSLVLATHF